MPMISWQSWTSRIDPWDFEFFPHPLLRQELRRVFKLIADYPEVGALAEDIELPGVRRVLLIRTHHYLYYRPNAEAERVEVLAV